MSVTVGDRLVERLRECNNDLNQVTWKLRALGGAPTFEPSRPLPDISYAEVAKSFRLNGIVVLLPDRRCRPAW